MKGKSAVSAEDQKDKSSKVPVKKPASQADNQSVGEGKKPASISDNSITGSKPVSNKNKFTINQKAKDDDEDIQDDHQSVSNLKLEKDDYDKLGKQNFIDSVGQDTQGMINDIGKPKTREVTRVYSSRASTSPKMCQRTRL